MTKNQMLALKMGDQIKIVAPTRSTRGEVRTVERVRKFGRKTYICCLPCGLFTHDEVALVSRSK